MAHLIESIVQRPQIDFVAHITEAWMQKGFPEGRIADNPERMETILFNILSKDYQTLVVNPLRRNPSRLECGKIDFLNLLVGGRFARPMSTRN